MKIALHFIAAFLLLVTGWCLHSSFFVFSLEQLKPSQVTFQSIGVTEQFSMQFSFALLFASMPLIHLILQSLLKIKKTNQIVLLYVLMVASALLFWQIRISILKEQIKSFDAITLGTNIQSSIGVNKLHLASYMAFGILLAALTFLALKKIFQSKNNLKPDNEF